MISATATLSQLNDGWPNHRQRRKTCTLSSKLPSSVLGCSSPVLAWRPWWTGLRPLQPPAPWRGRTRKSWSPTGSVTGGNPDGATNLVGIATLLATGTQSIQAIGEMIVLHPIIIPTTGVTIAHPSMVVANPGHAPGDTPSRPRYPACRNRHLVIQSAPERKLNLKSTTRYSSDPSIH